MSKFLGTGSPLTCLNGCVASSQFYASEIGVNILKAGGNAADASVAMAAALGVLEPFSTGVGGDAFCLYFDASEKKVCAMNASGRSPAKLTRELLNERGFTEKTGYPANHGLSVTVPGTTLGWFGCVERFGSGKFSMKSLLQPSINLARNGFPIAGPITSQKWQWHLKVLLDERNINSGDFTKTINDAEDGVNVRAPKHGEIFKNPKLATVMEELADKGPDVFYNGWISDSIVEAVNRFGGVLGKSDLKNAKASYEEPISIDYKGFTVWEASPNSQGIVALIALNILKNIDVTAYSLDSPQYWHIMIEVFKLAFADGMAYCADPSVVSVPVSELLSAEYGKTRAELINMDSAMSNPIKGCPTKCGSDTVYFTVVDKDRNACSFINSISNGFGSGIIPNNCGFCLHNRGAKFSLKQDHCNVVAPRKRPYHTLIPGMVTDSRTGELVMSFGVMGGFMQPQGHVQVFLNCVEFGMNPQQALDYPRIRIAPDGGATRVQDDMPSPVITSLKAKGHNIETVNCSSQRFDFGVGQAIATRQFWNKDVKCGGDEVLFAGTDRRHDGIAFGY